MREIAVEGKVRRVEVGEWTDKNTGQVRPNGNVVLAGEFDKLEIGLDRVVSPATLSKLRGIHEGETVRLLVGVASGDSFRAEARFIFLDDLTQRPKG